MAIVYYSISVLKRNNVSVSVCLIACNKENIVSLQNICLLALVLYSPLYRDNRSANMIASNPVFHEKIKYIKIDLYFVRRYLLRQMISSSVSSVKEIARLYHEFSDDPPILNTKSFFLAHRSLGVLMFMYMCILSGCIDIYVCVYTQLVDVYIARHLSICCSSLIHWGMLFLTCYTVSKKVVHVETFVRDTHSVLCLQCSLVRMVQGCRLCIHSSVTFLSPCLRLDLELLS